MPYSLRIPSTEISKDPTTKPYTQYNLEISTPLRTQVLEKRYSSFTTLHAALQQLGAPPAPLPSKSWFTRTINSPEFTEERRKGLEAYLQAIESSPDPKWRSSPSYRSFLGFSTSQNEGRRRSALEEEALGEAAGKPSMSAHQWLDVHSDLKMCIQAARLALSKRDQAATVTIQHEASATARKSLAKALTLILKLEEGLKGLSDGKGGNEKLGEGEIRRRKDLISRARKEREGLEGVLNSFPVTRSSAGRSSPDGYGKSKRDADAESIGSGSSKGMPGGFPGGGKVGGGRRVLGAPAKETERTRELDNEGVLQLQQQIMKAQDDDVQDLTVVVRRMKEMGIAINEELVDQGQLLDVLDQDVDRVGGKIDLAKKRIKGIR